MSVDKTSVKQSAYQGCAIMFFNTFILFVLVNVIIGYYQTGRDKLERATPGVVGQTMPKMAAPKLLTHLKNPGLMYFVDEQGFEGMPVDKAEKTIDSMPGFEVSYESWVEFRPKLWHSEFMNNDVDNGEDEFTHRRSILAPELAGDPKLPVVQVYVFGGSTMWGWNTADDWTIASYLWAALQKKALASHPPYRIELINYGRPMYYSSEEVVLFRRLLQAGHVPKVAVFLDGLNDVLEMAHERDFPKFREQLQQVWYEADHGKHGDLETYQWIPMVRLAFELRHRMHPDPNPAPIAVDPNAPAQKAKPSTVDFVTRHYGDNLALVNFLSQQYGVKTYFFWQPVPYYHYDPSLSLHFPANDKEVRDVFVKCFDYVKSSRPDVVFLGDLLQEWGKPAFVDTVHYGPAFSRFLAERMAQSIHMPAPSAP